MKKKQLYLKEAQNLYYPTFTDSIGLSEIYKFTETKINKFSIFIKILKILFQVFFFKSKIIKNLKKSRYSNIIFTWANFNNFRSDGSLDDRFFNINSKKIQKILYGL